jgi:O-antigen/teichoic acid export membrane protein
MESAFKRFIRDVGWSFASLGIAAVVNFILRIFLARYLGAADLGLYSLAFAFYSFGLVLSGFGIGAALTKYTAQYKGDSSRLRSLLSSGRAISLASGCLMGIMLYLLSPLIADRLFHMPEMRNLLRIVALAFPCIALEKAYLGFLNGLRQMRAFAIINIGQNVLVVVLTAVLVVLGAGVAGAVLALVLPVVLFSVLSLYPIRGFISKPNLIQHSTEIKAMMSFSLYVVLASAISATQGQVDTFMVGYYMNTTEVGYFAAALMVALGMGLPSSAIQMITGPDIAGYWGNRDVKSIESMVNRVMKLTAVFMIPLVFVVAFFANELSTIVFGDGFAPAGSPLQILMVGTLFGSVQTSVGSALSSTAFVKVLFKLNSMMLISSIIMNILLIPHFGVVGAAVSNSTPIVVAALLCFYIMHRLIKIRIDWAWFARLLLFTSLIAGVTYAAGLVISLYVCVPVATVILIIVLYKRFMSREDIAAIHSSMNTIIRSNKSKAKRN